MTSFGTHVAGCVHTAQNGWTCDAECPMQVKWGDAIKASASMSPLRKANRHGEWTKLYAVYRNLDDAAKPPWKLVARTADAGNPWGETGVDREQTLGFFYSEEQAMQSGEDRYDASRTAAAAFLASDKPLKPPMRRS